MNLCNWLFNCLFRFSGLWLNCLKLLGCRFLDNHFKHKLLLLSNGFLYYRRLYSNLLFHFTEQLGSLRLLLFLNWGLMLRLGPLSGCLHNNWLLFNFRHSLNLSFFPYFVFLFSFKNFLFQHSLSFSFGLHFFLHLFLLSLTEILQCEFSRQASDPMELLLDFDFNSCLLCGLRSLLLLHLCLVLGFVLTIFLSLNLLPLLAVHGLDIGLNCWIFKLLEFALFRQFLSS